MGMQEIAEIVGSLDRSPTRAGSSGKTVSNQTAVTAGPVSRILSARLAAGRTVIPLGRASLRGSSDLPGGETRRVSARTPKAPLPPYLVLLRVGFALPAPLLERRCALTAPFHPYPAIKDGKAVYFLWHFSVNIPLRDAARTLSGTLLCGVRTFLP